MAADIRPRGWRRRPAWAIVRGVNRQLLDRVARRSRFTAHPDAVTDRGDEHGDAAVADAIWDRVVDVYRTGMHPGLQLCIRHRGEVVVDRAVGHGNGVWPGQPVDDSRATPMTRATPVNLFSAAKAGTGMAMHKLEERGVLSLDDRVADHIPGFDRHGKADITIRHVLSHRSGVADLPAFAFDLDLLCDPERIEQLVCDLEPAGPPGGPPAYHAVVGGFVLDVVARHASGSGLRDVLDADIRAPLGLDWFHLGVPDDAVEDVARNVETGLPLGPLNLVFDRVLNTSWSSVVQLSNDPRFIAGVIPSGNLIATAVDTAAFYQCLLNGGELDGTRVFETATVERAVRHEGRGLPIDRKLFLPMRYSTAFMLGAREVSLYGFNHPRIFGHVGMSNTWTWADPERDLVVALLNTGKPIVGTHLVALPKLINTIHESFPVAP